MQARAVLDVTQETRPRPRRHRHGVRARTIHVRSLSRIELERGRALYPVVEGVERPRTRGECSPGERPCPFVSCRHHLAVDVAETGSIKINFPDLEVDELSESCSLDVAERGGATLENVARLMNLTRERVRQLEAEALRHVVRLKILERP